MTAHCGVGLERANATFNVHQTRTGDVEYRLALACHTRGAGLLAGWRACDNDVTIVGSGEMQSNSCFRICVTQIHDAREVTKEMNVIWVSSMLAMGCRQWF
jgi:hypothetical protein